MDIFKTEEKKSLKNIKFREVPKISTQQTLKSDKSQPQFHEKN